MAAYTAIDDPEAYFRVVLYTGNGSGSGQSITFDTTDTTMQPDLVWIKSRNDGNDHNLFDSVRGTQKLLEANNTDAEQTTTNALSAFDSNGFSFNGDHGQMNGSSDTNVAWCWKASGSTATNTAGNVDTTISANTTAGFSIISADAGSTSGELTLGHGLGTVPTMMIWKNREDAGQNWQVYHQANTTGLQIINLDTAKNTDVVFWNTHTTTLFKMATHMYTANKDFIGYCFSDRQGFLKAGSFTGNGSANGTFIPLTFRPAWFMCKKSSAAGNNWTIWDNKRDPKNPMDLLLHPNSTNAENDSGDNIDFCSNGIKLRNTAGGNNASAATYIYLAFAEAPFVNSKGVPCNAR